MDKGGNGTFYRIEKGIRELKKQNYAPCMIEATYTVQHQELGYDKPTIRKYLRETFDVNDILIADCEDNGTHEFSPIGIISDEEAIRENIFSYQTRVHKVMSAHKFVDLNCDAGLSSTALFPDGQIYPCHRFIVCKDYCIAQYKKGHFDFSSYDQVLEKLRQAQKLQNPECKQCEINSLCRRCPFCMLLSEGIDHNKEFCRKEIESEHKAVLNYAKQLLLN